MLIIFVSFDFFFLHSKKLARLSVELKIEACEDNLFIRA